MCDVFEPEGRFDLGPRNDLAAGGLGARRGPAERHQIVDHRLREVALVAVLLERHLVAPLRQLLSLLVDQHRHVGPPRWFVTERLPEHLLLGSVGQVLLGAHDVRDRHLDVVDHVREQEHRCAIAADQHEVLDRGVVECDLAAHDVPHDGGAVRHPEPQDVTRTRRDASLTRIAVVSGGAELLGALLHLLSRQVAVVRVPVGEQTPSRGEMRFGVVALEVRAFEVGIVGRHTDPGECVDDALRPLGPVPRFVGVLDPEYERATESTDERPVLQRGPSATDVERTGG